MNCGVRIKALTVKFLYSGCKETLHWKEENEAEQGWHDSVQPHIFPLPPAFLYRIKSFAEKPRLFPRIFCIEKHNWATKRIDYTIQNGFLENQLPSMSTALLIRDTEFSPAYCERSVSAKIHFPANKTNKIPKTIQKDKLLWFPYSIYIVLSTTTYHLFHSVVLVMPFHLGENDNGAGDLRRWRLTAVWTGGKLAKLLKCCYKAHRHLCPTAC